MRALKKALQLGIGAVVAASGVAIGGAPAQAAIECTSSVRMGQAGYTISRCSGLLGTRQQRAVVNCLFVSGGGAYTKYGTWERADSDSVAYCNFNGIAINGSWQLSS